MEIGWSELLVIGVVALIVIGPKDLPEMFRTLGRFTAKIRSMARDFSRAMEDAGRETGLNDVANDLRKVASPKSMGLEAVKNAADKFEQWDPLKGARPGAVAPAAGAVAAGAAATDAAAVEASVASAPVATSIVPPNVAAMELGAVPPSLANAGPNTAALAKDVAERQAAAQEAGERLRQSRSDQADAPKDSA